MSSSNLKLFAVGAAVAAITIAGFATLRSQPAASTEITVYKSPTCGCCAKWVDHLRANGFTVTTHDVEDMTQIKAQYGITSALGSCHTATIGGYVIEGHVPADAIHKILEERPTIAGLAVPGMPVGSPGMEGPNPQRYNIVAFDPSGNTFVYQTR